MSADVVESSVAQLLEAVVGVDKMLYMKSTSGNTQEARRRFHLRWHQPDINTANVSNRVQTGGWRTARSKRGQGLTVQKKSRRCCSSSLYSQNGAQERFAHHQPPSSTCSTRFLRNLMPARPPVSQPELLDVDLVHAMADQLDLASPDVIAIRA